MLARRLDDLDDNHLARLRVAAAVGRDHQVLVDAAVLRLDEPDAALLVDAADDVAIRALQHVDDLAFRAAAPVEADSFRRHAIAVQHLVHLAGRQEEIVAAGIGNQETEPVRVALDRAGDEVELGDDAKLALAVDEQLAVARERGDAFVKAVLLLAAQAESRRDLGGREGRARLAEFAQDGFRTQCEGWRNVAGALARLRCSGFCRRTAAKGYRF